MSRSPWHPLKIWFPDHSGPARLLKHPFAWFDNEVALLNPDVHLEHPDSDSSLVSKLVPIAVCRGDLNNTRTLIPIRSRGKILPIVLDQLRKHNDSHYDEISKIKVMPLVIIQRRSDWSIYQQVKAAHSGHVAVLVQPVEYINLGPLFPMLKMKAYRPSWLIIMGKVGRNALPCRPEWIDEMVALAQVRRIPVMVLDGGAGDWYSRTRDNADETVPRVRLTICGCNGSSDIPIYGVRGSHTSTDHKCDMSDDSWVQKSGWEKSPPHEWPREFPRGWGPLPAPTEEGAS